MKTLQEIEQKFKRNNSGHEARTTNFRIQFHWPDTTRHWGTPSGNNTPSWNRSSGQWERRDYPDIDVTMALTILGSGHVECSKLTRSLPLLCCTTSPPLSFCPIFVHYFSPTLEPPCCRHAFYWLLLSSPNCYMVIMMISLFAPLNAFEPPT